MVLKKLSTSVLLRHVLPLILYLLIQESRAKEKNENTSSKPLTKVIKDATKPLLPGTNWCGAGNRADSDSDINIFYKTDICCRDHDQCPLSIKSSESKCGLRNDKLYTLSHCSCDQKFYKCLKEADTPISETIFHTYFIVLRPKCFKKGYPIVKCKKTIDGKCIANEKKVKKKQAYQWFDSPAM